MYKTKLLCLPFAALLLVSCAQMGPPVPPSLELPKPVTDLKAVRKGDKVYLQWSLPLQTTDGESVSRLGTTRICRSFDQSAKQCDVAGQVAPTQVSKASSANAAQPVNEAIYADTLPSDVQQNSQKILTYSVSVENESGRSAGFSNHVQAPAVSAWSAPLDFKAQITADGVVLTWTSPTSSGAPHSSYRIYRRLDGTNANVIAGELPVDSNTTQFVDHGFEWEKTYDYRVTVVTQVSAEGMHTCGTPQTPMDCATVYQFEGDDSPTVKVSVDDTFPPSVPSGLQAVFSGEGQKPFVDLVWAPNAEGDLAGYNVYRRDGNGQAVKLNSELVKPPAYRDGSVQSGKQYFYSVTAVDLRNNESGRSEEASEQVP